ncbi:MAG TPA: cell wall hydrolase [Bacillales bacterium]|nr:cell wall hydrolase [Bacillales bacterium]
MKRILIMFMIAAAFGIGISEVLPGEKVEAAAPTLSMGDHAGYVWGLQHRLQQLGLYHGLLDGIFGPLTREAVITFQQRYGLTADGIVGEKTWHRLRANTFTKEQIQLFAQLVYAEARGESFEGQVAVAAVVLNRMDSGKFPDTLSGVVYKSGAFSCVDNGAIYNRPNEEAYRAVYAAVAGWDPTDGALFYFNPEKSDSKWMRSRPTIVTIGNHVFS